MSNKEKTTKIKEIQSNFTTEVHRLEKWRDEQIKAVKKGIDQRRVEKLSQNIKNML